MQLQICPKCGTKFDSERGWANAAVSLLMPAPAIPDMATQVRCTNCGHVFADGEVRHFDASSNRVRTMLIALLAVIVVAWALSQVF